MMCVLLSMGSNLGDRAANLRSAVDALGAGKTIRVKAVSHCYLTQPWGDEAQPAFLNIAAEIETDLDPLELLKVVKRIERDLGRTSTSRWGPRVIDIDIILWGDRILATPELSVPHVQFRSRAFVLVPLAEIAGEAVDPESGNTIAELAELADAVGEVQRAHKLDH